MPSVWITTRVTSKGLRRHRVMFRVGGRESMPRYGGSFETKREATRRKNWIADELAAMRVPDLQLVTESVTRTLTQAAGEWRRSRLDVGAGTATTHQVNLSRILPRLGTRPVDKLTVADVAGLVGELHEAGLARETIRKTRSTLAQVIDFAGVQPNPARDKNVKLPREDSEELSPPTAPHVLAVHGLLRSGHRLALVVLDATGMRVGELEALVWGDVDEPAGRWRVRRKVSKTGQPRWVPVVPVELFDAVAATVPREDRDLGAQVLSGFGADRFRTALTRACKAAGVPEFSPHDLRHRRATLWHLQGVPPVEAAAWLGHSPTEHLKTYAHATLTDRAELDYVAILESVESAAAATAMAP